MRWVYVKLIKFIISALNNRCSFNPKFFNKNKNFYIFFQALRKKADKFLFKKVKICWENKCLTVLYCYTKHAYYIMRFPFIKRRVLLERFKWATAGWSRGCLLSRLIKKIKTQTDGRVTAIIMAVFVNASVPRAARVRDFKNRYKSLLLNIVKI